MRPRRHFNLHLDLLLSLVVACRRQVVETRHTNGGGSLRTASVVMGRNFSRANPCPVQAFGRRIWGCNACAAAVIGLAIPSYAAQTLGLRQVAPSNVMQTRMGQPRRRRPAVSLGLRAGALVRLALLESFPGSDFAPVTSLCGYDTNTNEDIDSRHGSLSRWWQPGDGVYRRAAQADCCCSSPFFSSSQRPIRPKCCLCGVISHPISAQLPCRWCRRSDMELFYRCISVKV